MSEKHDRLKELRIDRADIESTGSGGGSTLAIVALVLVGAAAAAWWWLRDGGTTEVRVARAELVSPRALASSDAVLDASGYVTARRRATVSSKFTGKIVDVGIEEGMRVTEGQVLARLDDTIQTRSLALAEAQLQSARTALAETEVRLREAGLDAERLRKLVEGDVASQSLLDTAEANRDALKARLERQGDDVAVAEKTVSLRQQELDDTVIRAPFAGVVVTKNAQPGEMISPVSAGGGFTRTGIGTVVDMSSLEIEVDVNEAYIQRVSDGQAVEATLDAYPDWRISAYVITAVPTADRQKATVRVRVGFDQLDPRILPDMGVKVAFLSRDADQVAPAETAPDRSFVAVPEAAIVPAPGEGDSVFVVREGIAELRTVSVETRRSGRAWLTDGVESGETVVVDPPPSLTAGDPVRPTDS
ncbi:MAG: efflux RND transporter periplasmic adaptor subunit [Thermoanaerobaculia bacterium]|nr:efflux RND transporter periplasmic adaptor subunit [Thermoanaerobaculia bacterium]